MTVERIEDGEVSPFLTEELRVSDTIELRGPIGGYFAWDVADGGPLMLVAGRLGHLPADGDAPPPGGAGELGAGTPPVFLALD